MQVVRKSERTAVDTSDSDYQDQVTAWVEAGHEGHPPRPPRRDPQVFDAELLEEDAEWEHPEFGTIVGLAGNYKVTDENGAAVQVHAGDFDRQFEAL